MTLFSGIEGCTVIAEVAQSHDGHLDAAHGYIDAIAAAGAHGVKFQTHIAAAESTPHEPWRVAFSAQDKSRFDYWKRMEFSEEEWATLRAHATEKNLLFLSSPFSDEAVDLLERVGVDGWKIASGEVETLPMLEKIAATGKPVLLSTGMSPWVEIDTAVDILRGGRGAFAVMQCTSIYPTPPEQTGLNVISELRQRYDCAVGLSDHSGTIYPALAAVFSNKGRALASPEAIFQPSTPTRSNRSTASSEKGELTKSRSFSDAWVRSAAHSSSLNSMRFQ